MYRKIVLVGGFSKAGKDTFSDFFVEKCGYVKLSFSSFLKTHTAKKYNFEKALTFTQKGKETLINSKTVRELLILEALILRSEDDNIFANNVLSEIKNLPIMQNIIISDFRYKNELDVLTNGFVNCPKTCVFTTRITRPNIQISPVPSEHQLDNFNFDFTVCNNFDTKDAFYNHISNNIYCKFAI